MLKLNGKSVGGVASDASAVNYGDTTVEEKLNKMTNDIDSLNSTMTKTPITITPSSGIKVVQNSSYFQDGIIYFTFYISTTGNPLTINTSIGTISKNGKSISPLNYCFVDSVGNATNGYGTVFLNGNELVVRNISISNAYSAYVSGIAQVV